MDYNFPSSFELDDLLKSVRMKLAPIKPRTKSKPAGRRKEKQPEVVDDDLEAKVL